MDAERNVWVELSGTTEGTVADTGDRFPYAEIAARFDGIRFKLTASVDSERVPAHVRGIVK
jgi:hypothetical protein